MRWSLDNPDGYEAIQYFVNAKKPIPEHLVAPALHDIEQELWGAFWELSTERQDSGRPLVWRSIRDYGKMLGIELRLFQSIMRRMDDVYITHKAGKAQGAETKGQVFSREMLRK